MLAEAVMSPQGCYHAWYDMIVVETTSEKLLHSKRFLTLRSVLVNSCSISVVSYGEKGCGHVIVMQGWCPAKEDDDGRALGIRCLERAITGDGITKSWHVHIWFNPIGVWICLAYLLEKFVGWCGHDMCVVRWCGLVVWWSKIILIM